MGWYSFASDLNSSFNNIHSGRLTMTTPKDLNTIDEIFNPATLDDLEIPQWWVEKTKKRLNHLLIQAKIDEVQNHILKELVGSGEPKSAEIVWKRLEELKNE
jgi:hypothetical protein